MNGAAAPVYGEPDERQDRIMQVIVTERFQGPPGIGHGGYVAGHLATGSRATQVTLRRPTPLGVSLEILDGPEGRRELRHGEELIAEAEGAPSPLSIDVPEPPGLHQIEAAEPSSPSHFNGSGVHPACFGCSPTRSPGDGLRLAAAPLRADGREQVAATWTPTMEFAGDTERVDPRYVVAALDCPGAFAFIADGQRAGLLGRITFELRSDVPIGEPHIVTGWQIDSDGRKFFAGTAVFSVTGELRAVASSTWFPFSR